MAAYWHIILPLTITIRTDLDKEFNEKYRDVFVKINEFQNKSYSPKLPDGSRLEFTNCYIEYENIYLEDIYKNIVSFMKYFYEEFNYEFQKGNYEHQNAYNKDDFNLFVNELKNFNIHDLETFSQKLKNCESNYFMSYESIREIYVYEGYPLKKDYYSNIEGFSIMRSYFKMQECSDTCGIFKKHISLFNKKFYEKYKFSGNLFVMGY
jgi:hypothetical protein